MSTPEDIIRPLGSTISPEERKQVHAAVREADKTSDDPAEVDLHDDRTRENRAPGFSRMRTQWDGDDGLQVASLKAMVDDAMLTYFPDAIMIMTDLFNIVRTPMLDEQNEIVVDRHGLPIWVRGDSGAFLEDYSRLTYRDKEDILFRITTNLVRWKEIQADLWGEAMFAKAIWEERFSSQFLHAPGMRPTIEDKTNRARSHSVDERYFAIFKSLISRRADATVDGMILLGQRIKDVID